MSQFTVFTLKYSRVKVNFKGHLYITNSSQIDHFNYLHPDMKLITLNGVIGLWRKK